MPRPEESAQARVEQLAQVRAFAPPPAFAARARVRDEAEYARAAGDGPGWWAEQASQRLDWHALSNRTAR
jgi:hypothetical protein